MSAIDDILARLQPEETKKQMQGQRDMWWGELHRFAAQRSIMELNPHLNAEQKQQGLANIERVMLEVNWAVEEIDKRMAAADIAASTALNGNRAQRRAKA